MRLKEFFASRKQQELSPDIFELSKQRLETYHEMLKICQNLQKESRYHNNSYWGGTLDEIINRLDLGISMAIHNRELPPNRADDLKPEKIQQDIERLKKWQPK